MDSQRSSAPAEGRAHSLWTMLRSLLEGFRTATPAPVPIPVRRIERRR